MQAERVVLETDDQGNLQGLPKLPPRARIEAVFLVLDGTGEQPRFRTPPVELLGLSMDGDIVSPAIELDAWGFAK
jgi:hypothetical protein